MQLVKSKTPKVTLYNKYAKVMLMENSPNADLEVCFYDGESNGCDPAAKFAISNARSLSRVGAKTHKTSELVRVVEKSGKSYTVKGEVGLSGLSPESRLYVELSDEGHSMCLALEAAITLEEQRSTKKVPFFPITIGRWDNAVTEARCQFLYTFALIGNIFFACCFRRPANPSSPSLPSHSVPPQTASPPQAPQITPSVSLQCSPCI